MVAVTQLCLEEPSPAYQDIEDAIPVFLQVIQRADKPSKIISPSLLAIWNISEKSEDQIRTIIDSGFLPEIIEFMCHKSKSTKYFALCFAAKVAEGNELQKQYLIDNGVIEAILGLFKEKDISTKREAVGAISHLCCLLYTSDAADE